MGGNQTFRDDTYKTQLKADIAALGQFAIPSYNNQLTNSRCRLLLEIRAQDVNAYEQGNLKLHMGLFHLGMNLGRQCKGDL